MSLFQRLRPDNFTIALAATVLLASVLPASGQFGDILDKITSGVIVMLFFLHGSKLSRSAIWAGISHWRLHLVVTLTTFAFFRCWAGWHSHYSDSCCQASWYLAYCSCAPCLQRCSLPLH